MSTVILDDEATAALGGYFGVASVIAPTDWRPGNELPDDFELVEMIARDICEELAGAIADYENQHNRPLCVRSNCWTVVLPVDWLNHFRALP